jgi:pantoate--beta-alanine ligase
LEKYPSTLTKDKTLLEQIGVDYLFTPSVNEMYPADLKLPEFSLGDLDKVLEGKYREGHFQGVAQAVYRLFDIVKPDYAVFGTKDLQQVAVIRKMLSQTSMNIEIIPVETERDEQSLALSSRNQRLSSKGLIAASSIGKSLINVKSVAKSQSVGELVKIVREEINAAGLEVEYVEAVDTDTFSKDLTTNNISICVAAYLEGVRLIDNIQINA